jgi:hypothetical protein
MAVLACSTAFTAVLVGRVVDQGSSLLTYRYLKTTTRNGTPGTSTLCGRLESRCGYLKTNALW